MGYELYREVKVWAPPSLTHREKLTAMVLADDANDRTRLTWNSVVDPEIMRQAMVPDDRAMRRIIARLKEEKVLEHVGGGHNGRAAKYRFLHLAPAGSSTAMPGENDPATAGVGGSESPPYDRSPEGKAGENDPPTDGVAGSFSASSRVKKTPPTPSPPTTSPLSVAEQVVRASDVVADDERETFISWINNQHQPRGPAWWRTVAKNGDLADLAETWRAQGTEQTNTSAVPAWCGYCGDDNPAARFNPNFRLLDGTPCPDCHPNTLRSNAS